MVSAHPNLNSTATAVDFDPFASGEVLLTAPATEAQKEIWASVRMGQEANCAYNESQSLRLMGAFDRKAFERAIQSLVLRHESLRSTLSPDGQHLCINDDLVLEITGADWSELPAADRAAQIAQRRQQAVKEPFDLEHGPLVRVELYRLQSEEHFVLITAHHIICDGWSWAVLMNDLGQLYSAYKAGTTPELEPVDRFSDYAQQVADQAASPDAQAAEQYWLKLFADSVPVVDFPTDRSRSSFRTFNADREDYDLSPQLVAELKQLGKTAGCSFMSVLLAGFEAWLARLTQQADVVVGVLAAGQAASGLYNLVGHCVSLLPMRSRVDSQQSFRNYLAARKSTILDAYDHQQFTYGSLVQKLRIPRDPSRIPLAPILLNIDQGLDSSKLPFDGLTVEFFSNPRAYENFELFVNATELNGRLTLECQYNTNLFDGATIRQRMAELETLLSAIVQSPDQAIGQLPLLPASEWQQIQQWNQTQVPYASDACIHHLVAQQAAATPEATAVMYEEQRLSYGDLDRRANQLAHYLQSQGVGPDTLVGISLERSPDLLVAMLGVLKAGGAYVPLDPSYPTDRLAYMMTDARLTLLLTDSTVAHQVPSGEVATLQIDRDWPTIAQQSSEAPASPVTPDHLAYVIYTSGSTGQPKGVQVPHRGVVNFLQTMAQQPGIQAQDVLLSVTTLSFDIAVLELLLPLTVGASTVLVSRATAMNGEALLQTLVRSQATIMQATPATWRLLLASGWTSSPNLKILCGGEALTLPLAQELTRRVKEVWNMYGPTETTIWSTCYPMAKDASQVLIGRPISNTQVYVLDEFQQPVPIGVPGELYIGGTGVVRGYWNRPDVTAERFISDRLSSQPDARLYRTGDLVRLLPNGNLEYLQRIDNQVKVRGFRIELGEIEATMLQASGVKEAVVTVREETSGEKTLVGYVVPQGDSADLTANLRQFLRGKLPDYMVPNAFMVLDALPLTPNGKVDRKALPAPEATRRDLIESYVAPRTPVEQTIAEIWANVLSLDRVGIHDNFFELGGYSLLAIQIVSRLRPALQVEIPLPSLFDLPTVAELANRVEALRWATQSGNASIADGAEDYEEGEL
ncbi:MAG: non-ribosomal peptide synthetase [Alkalinema sp. CACIAM 70d]|nr:MAG: non-ribosomal peptide synthetase [Alkalinema sp. CACIAM 70d]